MVAQWVTLVIPFSFLPQNFKRWQEPTNTILTFRGGGGHSNLTAVIEKIDFLALAGDRDAKTSCSRPCTHSCPSHLVKLHFFILYFHKVEIKLVNTDIPMFLRRSKFSAFSWDWNSVIKNAVYNFQAIHVTKLWTRHYCVLFPSSKNRASYRLWMEKQLRSQCYLRRKDK